MKLVSKRPVESAPAKGSNEGSNMDRIDFVNAYGIDHWNVPLWQVTERQKAKCGGLVTHPTGLFPVARERKREILGVRVAAATSALVRSFGVGLTLEGVRTRPIDLIRFAEDVMERALGCENRCAA